MERGKKPRPLRCCAQKSVPRNQTTPVHQKHQLAKLLHDYAPSATHSTYSGTPLIVSSWTQQSSHPRGNQPK